MAANQFTYRKAAELPGLVLPWEEEVSQDTWSSLDLSTGYTFTLTLVDSAGVTVLTKTTNITGADGSVTIAWATDELDITVGMMTLYLRARETATSKDRDYQPADPIMLRIVT